MRTLFRLPPFLILRSRSRQGPTRLYGRPSEICSGVLTRRTKKVLILRNRAFTAPTFSVINIHFAFASISYSRRKLKNQIDHCQSRRVNWVNLADFFFCKRMIIVVSIGKRVFIIVLIKSAFHRGDASTIPTSDLISFDEEFLQTNVFEPLTVVKSRLLRSTCFPRCEHLERQRIFC